MSSRHPSCPCPSCGREIDAATHAGRGEATPKVGDVSVCFYCAAVLEYGPGLILLPLDIETLPIELRAKLRRMVALVRAEL